MPNSSKQSPKKESGSATKVEINTGQFLDPVWRLSNLYTIVDKQGRPVRFQPNWAQQEFLENFHRRNIILKARQIGFTTLCCLVYLDDCLFNPNTSAAVIAHRLDDAKKIFKTKVKFPYDQLDDGLRQAVPLKQDSADTLSFANNSSILVTTSTRSGTFQWLHVSEYGKICAQFPDKAQEIRTGAFPSVPASGRITIESTAEGQEGDFYEKTQAAQSMQRQGVVLSPLDYRFHFYPWWREAEYAAEYSPIRPSPEDVKYFGRIEQEIGCPLTKEQVNWWLSKEAELGGDMKREFPATADEAFEQALEGAYFVHQIASAEKHGRIGTYPVDAGEPVNTFWDLGRNDFTTIWLHQFRGSMDVFVGFYKNSGEHISHYIRWLKEWADERGVMLGDHYWPHDGKRQDLFLEDGRLGVAENHGLKPRIVERTPNKQAAIEAARTKFSTCAFDGQECAEGIKDLKAYRKEWDETRGVWRDRPRHDEASHTADGFLTFTQSKAQKRRGRRGKHPEVQGLSGYDAHEHAH